MMRSNLTSKLKVLNNFLFNLIIPFRTLEKMGLRKKVADIGEYQDYSSTSEEEDLLLSKP